MSVVVSTENTGPCKQKLEISVPVAAVEAETERLVGEYRKQARIPGFRKGKVPAGVIKKQFAEDIQRELIDRLLPRYWKQAEAEASLDLLMPPNVEKVDVQEDGSLLFVATVETRPEITLGNIDSFDLPDVPVDPSDDEITAALEDVRKELSDWVDVDRAAAQGDLVVGTIVELDGEGEALGEPHPVRFELGEARVWEELSLAATGKKAGKKVSFDRTEPAPPQPPAEGEEATEEAPQDIKKHFELTMEQIQEKDLLPLDDSLAEKAGEYTDFAALRAEVAGRIRAAKKQDRRSQRERVLIDQLVERHPTEVPEGVVQQEVEGMLREYAEGMMMRGVDVEKAEINWQELGEQVQPQATRRVHSRLVLDAVAAEKKIEVESAEMETALADIGKAQQMTTTAVRQHLHNNGGLERLESQIKHDKVVRRLIGEDDMPTDAPASEDAAAEAEDEG